MPENTLSDSVPSKPGEPSLKGELPETVIFQPGSSVNKSATELPETRKFVTTPEEKGSNAPKSSEAGKPSPAVYGRYEVRGTLGTGGFGTVFLGHDVQLDRAVAIKVLHSESVKAGHGDQFLEEARNSPDSDTPGL